MFGFFVVGLVFVDLSKSSGFERFVVEVCRELVVMVFLRYEYVMIVCEVMGEFDYDCFGFVDYVFVYM